MSSLIQCPACGNDVSSSANSCPNCGHKINSSLTEKAIQVLVWGAVIYFGVYIFAYGSLFVSGSFVVSFLKTIGIIILAFFAGAALIGLIQGLFDRRNNKPKNISNNSFVGEAEEKTEFEKRHNL